MRIGILVRVLSLRTRSAIQDVACPGLFDALSGKFDIRAVLGSIDRAERVVKTLGMVNCTRASG
jgi:hypothetical protein